MLFFLFVAGYKPEFYYRNKGKTGQNIYNKISLLIGSLIAAVYFKFCRFANWIYSLLASAQQLYFLALLRVFKYNVKTFVSIGVFLAISF